MSVDELWDKLVEYDIATVQELELVTSLNGYTTETLNDVLYVRTGYNSWEQMAEAEGFDEE